MKSELKYTTKPPWYGIYNTGAKAIKNTLIQSFTSGHPDTPDTYFKYIIPWIVKIGDNEFRVSIKDDEIQFYLVNINENDNYKHLYLLLTDDGDEKIVEPNNANLKATIYLNLFSLSSSYNVYLKNTGELLFLRYEGDTNVFEIIITDDGYIQFHKLLNSKLINYSEPLIGHCKLIDTVQNDTKSCYKCVYTDCLNYNDRGYDFKCDECIYNDICYKINNGNCKYYKNKDCIYNNKFCINCSHDYCDNNKTEGIHSDTCLKNVKSLECLNNTLFRTENDACATKYFLLKPKYYELDESEQNNYNVYQFVIDTENYISNTGFKECTEELYVIDKKNNDNVITTIPLIENTNDVQNDEILLGVKINNSHKYVKLKETTNIEDIVYHANRNKILNIKHNDKVYSNYQERKFTTNIHSLAGYREHIPKIADSNTDWINCACYYIESRKIRYIHGQITFNKTDNTDNWLPDGDICKSFRIYYDNKEINKSMSYTSTHHWDSEKVLTDHPAKILFTIDVAKNNGLDINNFNIDDLEPIRRIAYTPINRKYTNARYSFQFDFLVLEDAEPSNDSYIILP